MSIPVPRSRLDVWERRQQSAIAISPYAGLTVSAVITLIVMHGAALLIDLSLCALVTAWIVWMFTLHPAWRNRPPLMAVFFAGLVAITTVLVIRAPWFGFFAFTGYFYSVFMPWPWRALTMESVAIVTGIAQAGRYPSPLVLASNIAANVTVVGAIAWFTRIRMEADEQRKQALDDLAEANRTLEVTLAENAGLHEQLLTQAREAGVLDERRRMAREIHDTLAQGLTGIVTQLQAAEQSSEEPAGWRRHFAAATALARESLSEARRSVDALRPEPLEMARLSEALANVARHWSALHGIAVQVATTGTARPMPPEAEFALLRAAQEALANVARHAQATRVGLTLSYLEHEVALDVRDDGRGFDPVLREAGSNGPPGRNGGGGRPADAGGSGGGGGFGLVAMRQRIEGLSGTLQVESEPGAGTAISACVPAAPMAARA
jgi:signal transduction histidine kinase